jgi:murein DD-endopeptidase MepM/ murein hydrolase activator NlpD
MVSVTASQHHARFGRRNAPHKIIIAKGDRIRSFTVNPWVILLCALFALTLIISFLAATSYLFFRDDILNAAIKRQYHLQENYENRMADLRQEIDRITSRQLLNQDAFEAKIDQLMIRQNEYAARSREVSELLQLAAKTGLAANPEAASVPMPPSRELSDDDITTGSLAPQTLEPASSETADKKASLSFRTDNPGKLLADLSSSLDNKLMKQDHVVKMLTAVAKKSRQDIHDTVIALGVKPSQIARTELTLPTGDNMGGPYLPPHDFDPFTQQVNQLEKIMIEFNGLMNGLEDLPIRHPAAGARVTSNFGNRKDPFSGRRAFHSGIDYAGKHHHPIRATGAGKVTKVGSYGGYGKMVEIDHGHGFTTRYAHLSTIRVKKGQHVSAGTIVGNQGNTGRSTGPHLHYETRINGSPVNPTRFLRAGQALENYI